MTTGPNAAACTYLARRLDELRSEFESGQRQLALLDQRRQQLSETLLRIGGAIQVMEESMAALGGDVSAAEVAAAAGAVSAHNGSGG